MCVQEAHTYCYFTDSTAMLAINKNNVSGVSNSAPIPVVDGLVPLVEIFLHALRPEAQA